MKRESKYTTLESDADVKRWLRSLARGSPVTSEVAKRRLGKACELLGLTPKSMVEKAEKDPQIMVAEEELEKHLAEGWQFVSVLPSQKILIRKAL